MLGFVKDRKMGVNIFVDILFTQTCNRPLQRNTLKSFDITSVLLLMTFVYFDCFMLKRLTISYTLPL